MMKGDLSLSQALGGLRIANPDDTAELQPYEPASASQAVTQQTHQASSDPVNSGSGSARFPITPTQLERNRRSTLANPSYTSPATQPADIDELRYVSRHPSTHRSAVQSTSSQAFDPTAAELYSQRSNEEHQAYTSHVQSGSIPSTGVLPPRRSSRGMTGGHISTHSNSPSDPQLAGLQVISNAEDWKDRGAAVSVRKEVDSNGRMVMRQVKKGVRDFSFGRTLGEGSYSTVYMATDRQTLKEYAIKVLEKRHIIKEKKIKYVNIEKNTLNRLTEHPGVVRLYYTFQDETSLYYVLDLCNGGELLGVLKKSGTFDMECTRFYAAQILDAVDYMHSRGVIHRDLKPENVLLDDQMHVKITDFGTAKLLPDPRDAAMQDIANRGIPEPSFQNTSDDGRAASFVGTAEYVSPELLTHKNACKASDLWAFGCIVYQLLAGRPPFKAATEYLTFQKIVNLEYDFPPGFPPAARDLVERCLVLDPARRLTTEHIRNHDFLHGHPSGKGLWRMKAPRLRPYVPPTNEASIIQLSGYPKSSSPAPIASARQQLSHNKPAIGGPRPARLITELPPPSQLDIEWSPVLTRDNERILKLGELLVISAPIVQSPHGKGVEDGHKKLSRFFGGSTTKKRQRLVMVTSSGRIVMAPAGGEEKRAKQELSLMSPDCSWRSQTDAKGQLVWCVDVGGQHYTFEDTRNTISESEKGFAEDWVESLDQARELAASQISLVYENDTRFADLSTGAPSPSNNIGGRGGYSDGMGLLDRASRSHLSKSQTSLDDPTPKRNRFSKRQSRNGLGSGSAF